MLADVGMPGPSGYDIAQHIKGTPPGRYPGSPLTGAFGPIDQAKAAAVGCDGVLAKPFEPQLVIGRVKELLARPKRPAAAPAAPAPPPAPEPAASWAPPGAAPGGAGELTTPQLPAAVSDFFDRLDQAFANLPGPETMKAAPATVDADIDWFGSTSPLVENPPDTDTWDRSSPQNMPDLPLSQAPPTSVLDSAGETGRSSDAAPVMPVSQPVSAALAPEFTPCNEPRAMPPLADAFAALLAAEQSGPAPLGAPEWPAAPTPAPPIPDLVEQVTRSVLEQLSDRVVRETVSDIVTEVAERLVREEIERIKSSIK